MKFHGIKMLGKIFAQIVSNIPFDAKYTSAIVLDEITGSLLYGDPSTNTFRTLNDVPSGSIFLFESDTAITSYSLLTTIDDAVVFITSGSGAGGETGGSYKSGGTWQMPSHQHNLSTHTHSSNSHYHTMQGHGHTSSSHRHQWADYQGANSTYSYNSGGSAVRVQDYGTAVGAGQAINEENATAYAAAGDFWTNFTAGGSTGGPSTDNMVSATGGTTTPSPNATDSQVGSTTWRPKGRNVTRQQRQ